MVVLIHTSTYLPYTGAETFWNYHWYRHALDIAVPFFFFASGFLLQGKTAAAMVRSAAKAFTLYLAASVVYMLFALICISLDTLILDESLSSQLTQLFEHWTVLTFLEGTLAQGHLWFLAALCGATLLAALATKLKTPPPLLLAIAAALYAAFLTGIIAVPQLDANDGIFKALFYLAIGLCVSQATKNAALTHTQQGVGAALGTLGIIGYTATQITGISDPIASNVAHAGWLTLAITGIGFWATNPTAPETKLSRLATYSLTVYILHMALINVVNRTATYTGTDLDTIRGLPGYPFLVTALIVAGCIALHRPFSAYVAWFSRLLPPYRKG